MRNGSCPTDRIGVVCVHKLRVLLLRQHAGCYVFLIIKLLPNLVYRIFLFHHSLFVLLFAIHLSYHFRQGLHMDGLGVLGLGLGDHLSKLSLLRLVTFY